MSYPFDPYYEWLGIPPEAQPADYYRLLGVMLYESNLNVISNAADQKMIYIRTFQNGVHSYESQMILNELAQARVTLLNPSSKEAYDNQLRAFMLSREMPSQAPPVPGTTELIPGITEDQSWIYIINDQQFGPVSFTDIINLINEGIIFPSTPVCESGQQTYLAGDHPMLYSFFPMMGSNEYSSPSPKVANQTPAFQPRNYAPLSDKKSALFQSVNNSGTNSPSIGYNSSSVPNPLRRMVFVNPNTDDKYTPSPQERQMNIALLKARLQRIQEKINDKVGIDLNSNFYLLLAIIPFCIILLIIFGFVYIVATE